MTELKKPTQKNQHIKVSCRYKKKHSLNQGYFIYHDMQQTCPFQRSTIQATPKQRLFLCALLAVGTRYCIEVIYLCIHPYIRICVENDQLKSEPIHCYIFLKGCHVLNYTSVCCNWCTMKIKLSTQMNSQR